MLRLSVIIPTYNNAVTLEPCLRAVRSSSFAEYELIVADCASQDSTCTIAEKYADRVLKLPPGCGRNYARRKGAEAAAADIVVNIDSDVLISPNNLATISDYLSGHKEIDAVTGLLSKNHPHGDFFSQYKNLYMHYRFSGLPSCVNFLYGSIYAFRKPLAAFYDSEFGFADDTAFGQNLFRHDKKIVFLKDLEVVHLKQYTFFSLLKNDFLISFDWARVFIKYRSWLLLGKGKSFAHTSSHQLLGLAAGLITLCLIPLYLGRYVPLTAVWLSLSVWLIFQAKFFLFLAKQKGLIFIIPSFFIAFLSDLVKTAGIVCGMGSFLKKPERLI